MTEDELVSAIERQEALAETYGSLSEARVEALDYYLGEPMGNEVAGRSSVISRDVFDTVEWIKPQLADIFCAGDEVVTFTPRGPEDVKGAEQETEYVNYMITQRNRWFEIWNGWSHDALLQKNGYVKVYWDDAEDRTKEKYSNLAPEEYALLKMQDGVEIIEEEEQTVLGGELPITIYNITLERTKPADVARIVNVAPEHIFVDQNARGVCLQDPSIAFVEQQEYKTITQMRLEGFDIDDDINDGGDAMTDWEEDQRDEYSPFRDREGEQPDPSMRRIKVRECWMRVDYDGDGVAELRHVIVVGTTVLENEECDLVPIVALCPAPLPHQHYGLSVADAVMDLQRIKTALLRGSLDNVYLANNGRYGIDVDTVNLDDMLDSRPGGIVRVKGQPGASIFPLTHPTNGSIGVEMMEYVDKIKTQRTGVNEQSQGLNPNALSDQTATGANIMMTAAMQRIKFIARVFAETGVKSLFQVVHALTLQHGRKQELIRLRNQWVPVDPRQWVKRQDMQVTVGLGTGDKPQQLMLLEKILAFQVNGMQIGLANPPKIYHTLKKFIQTAGYKDADEYLNDPTTNPPPPQGPPLPILIEQAKGQTAMQIEQMKGQMQAQLKAAEAQLQAQKDQMQAEMDMRTKQAELELQASNDQRDSERELLTARYQTELATLEQQQNDRFKQLDIQLEKYKADLQSQTQLAIAKMTTGKEIPDMQEGPDPLLVDVATQQQAIAQGVMDMSQASASAMDQAVQQITAAAQMLAQAAQQMSRPRRITRGPDGKISGVE